MEKFWLIWNERGNPPQQKHFSQLLARSEAEGLARNNPSQTFHVLELVGSCRVVDIQWINYYEGQPNTDSSDLPY